MRFSNIRNYVPEVLLLGSAAILQFYRLGIGEFASWDESLYLVRAEACIKFGAWIDQTKYAIGGLYSSTHPPLAIWLMAIVRTSFGDGLIASRATAAISAVIAILFCYKLCRLIASREAAFVASISLACAQPFIWYGHHAQLDIPMMAANLAALYFFARSAKTNSNRDSVLAGIAFGIALSTKAFQALTILPVLALLPFIFQSTKKWKLIVRMVGVAAIISLPWYLYMILEHPDFLSNYTDLVTSLRRGSYSPDNADKRWWYYANQLLIAFPLLPIILSVFFSKSNEKLQRRLFLALAIWIAILLVLLSSMHTRMLHFVLHLLPLTVALKAIGMDHFHSIEHKGKRILILGFAALATIWSASEVLRRSIKLNAQPTYTIHWTVLIILLLWGVLSLIQLRNYRISLIPISLCLLLLVTSFYKQSTQSNEDFITGGEAVARSLDSLGVSSVAIVHPDYPHENLVPQLAYYSKGWTLGWRPEKKAEFLTWQQADSTITKTKTLPTQSVITYIGWDAFYKPTPKELELTNRLDSDLMSIYPRKIRANKYTLYY